MYFFGLTRDALGVFFSGDDLMNLYRAWSYPLTRLVRANLLFFETSPFYRPAGSAWYRSIYYFAGFDPMPFHLANLLLLAANGLLTYAVARRLSGSREAGFLAALLGCYHPAFNGLPFDTGFIFDVLCYFFYFAAFLFYLRIRQAGRLPNAWEWAACCGLCIGALNSKEMAVTLPAFLLLYEWIWHSPAQRRLWQWLWREGRAGLITGAITLLFAVGRATGEYSLLSNAAYRPVFTWQRFMETSRQFAGSLFFYENRFPNGGVLLLWAALLAIAWAARSKALRFAWLFLMLSPLPVAFVEPRGASQNYLPLFGWVLYAAVTLAAAGAWVGRRLPGRAASVPPALLFAALVLVLYPYYKSRGWQDVWGVTKDGVEVQAIHSQLRALHPALPAGARLLFRNEPAGPAWENLTALVRLMYRDDRILVHDLKNVRAAGDMAAYDYVFEYQGGRLIEMTSAPDPRLRPAICMTAQGPELYHEGFVPVSATRPLRAGETIIVKAAGLGPTSPEVAPGDPFPDAMPLVMARVGVRLGGREAEILVQVGWPGEVDRYRVDFRAPGGLRPGKARLELSVHNVPAPAVEVAVQ